MYNRTALNKRISNSLMEGENSIFKEERQKKVVEQVKKDKPPKPVFHKRQEKEVSGMMFYGVLFLIAIIALGINFYFAALIGSVSSMFAVVLTIYCLFFTNPDRWTDERHELAFWNASVTMSVLIKSIHFNLYPWRKVLMFGFAGGLALSYFISLSMIGVFGGLFLLTGLFFLAERNFELYSKVALGLAWVSIPALILSLILTKGIPLGIVMVALLLYQVYERVRYLEIEEPYFENE